MILSMVPPHVREEVNMRRKIGLALLVLLASSAVIPLTELVVSTWERVEARRQGWHRLSDVHSCYRVIHPNDTSERKCDDE